MYAHLALVQQPPVDTQNTRYRGSLPNQSIGDSNRSFMCATHTNNTLTGVCMET